MRKTNSKWRNWQTAWGMVLCIQLQAAGETIYVDVAACPLPGSGTPADPFCSIQAAIDTAVSGVDEVEVAPGIYLEAINFNGKAITVYSTDGPDNTTIDGAGALHVVVCDSAEGPNTVLDGFTITGGHAISGFYPDNRGGGMLNYDSSPTVTNCVFIGNSASVQGGGMYNDGFFAFFGDPTPTVTNCTFIGNLALNDGGGIYNGRSNPTVTNCTFTGNTAGGGGSGGGGMFNNSSDPTVTNCTFTGNTADVVNDGGGGMNNRGSNPTITNCTFSGNTAGGFGGGMYNDRFSGPTVTGCTFSGNTAPFGGAMDNYGSSHPIVTDSTFTGNSATSGGGMYNSYSSDPTVTNCTFSENSADLSGGGMNNSDASNPSVTNCTFSENVASGGGGGMYNIGSSPTATNCTFNGNSAGFGGGGMYNSQESNSTVSNCIFSGNTAAEGAGMTNNLNSHPTVTNCTFSSNIAAEFNGGGMLSRDGAMATVTNCILWGDTPNEIATYSEGGVVVTYSDIEGGWPGTGNINVTPLFVDALFGDYRLQPGSRCIDSGNNASLPEEITVDQNGDPRFVEDPSTVDSGAPPGTCPIVDMGAYEYQEGIDCGPCIGDTDDDGDVDVNDLRAVILNWGGSSGPADVNSDGAVNVNDLRLVIFNWGLCP